MPRWWRACSCSALPTVCPQGADALTSTNPPPRRRFRGTPIESWDAGQTIQFIERAGFSPGFRGSAFARRVVLRDLLLPDRAALLARAEGWLATPDDEQRLEFYIAELREDVLARPGAHSLWLQGLVRPGFERWGALWAFAPTVTLAALRLAGFRGSVVEQPWWAQLLCPFWPPLRAASEFLDTNYVFGVLFTAACALGCAVNVVFLLVAAQVKWVRIPFLLLIELAIFALVWVAWTLLQALLFSSLLSLAHMLLLLAAPFIRYLVLIQFDGGDYAFVERQCAKRGARQLREED